MIVARPFAYNPTLQTSGVSAQYGTFSVGYQNQSYGNSPGGIKWWNGPNEELGYVIGTSMPTGGKVAPDGTIGNVRFRRTVGFSDSSYITLSNKITGQSFTSTQDASNYFFFNGYWTAYPLTILFVGGTFSQFSPQNSVTNRIARLTTDGNLDTSFNIGTGFNNGIFTSLLQSDGKIIVGGQFTSYSGISSNRIARLNTDGSYDISFIVGTAFGNTIRTSSIQSNGKVIFGGDFTTYSGISSNYVARLNTDGSYDSSFVIGAGFNSTVSASLVQSDGKILLGGYFTTYSGVSRNGIVRLNTNGSYDSSFTIGTGFNGTPFVLSIQSDGKIIVGGDFISYSGISSSRIVRLNTDGSYDSSFVIGTGFSSFVQTISIQSDEKLIMGGAFNSYSGISTNNIVRLNTDGSYDSSFVVGGGFNATVRISSIQSDGKIVLGGNFSTYQGTTRNGIVRLNTDGSYDSSFVIGTAFLGGIVYSLPIQSDGKIIIGGFFTDFPLKINRFISMYNNGNYRSPFNIGTGFDSYINTSIIQSDGKVVVGGAFTSYSGISSNRIVRLNTNGSYDSSFVIGTGFNNVVGTFSVQSDGKIVIGGGFTSYSGISSNRIARLNTDGSYDSSFVVGTGFNSENYTCPIQSDGKILFGGFFTTYQGITRNRIVRLNTDGSYDTSFVIGTGFNASVSTLSIQSDGKIIVGGTFTSYSGISSNKIARLNINGSYDTSFVIGTGFDVTVNTSSIQSDGKIILGGQFTTYSGISSVRIIRLNTDGSYDNSFVIGTGFNNVVYTSSILSDGKIIIGGTFTQYQGITRNRLVILNTDGSYDSSFINGSQTNETIFTIATKSFT